MSMKSFTNMIIKNQSSLFKRSGFEKKMNTYNCFSISMKIKRLASMKKEIYMYLAILCNLVLLCLSHLMIEQYTMLAKNQDRQICLWRICPCFIHMTDKKILQGTLYLSRLLFIYKKKHVLAQTHFKSFQLNVLIPLR